MKKVFVFLTCLVLINICGSSCYSQQPPPPPPPAPAKPVKTIGKAEVYYVKSTDKTEVQTHQLIYDNKIDGKLDSLTLQARFKVDGQKIVVPNRVLFEFVTQTYEPKFVNPDDRRLTIYVDGNELGSGEMKVVNTIKWPQGNSTEWIGTAFDFATFSRIAKSSKVIMHIGKINVDFTDAQLEALRDMLRAIEP